MGRKGRPTAPELVARLVEIGAAELTRQVGVPVRQAEVVMREVAHLLCFEYGGQRVSIPRDLQYDLDARDREIWAAYNGRNSADLAAAFDITEQQVRNILAHVRRSRTRGTDTA